MSLVVPYDPLPLVSVLRRIPRFGRSDDFSDLFRSVSTARGYIAGVLFYGSLTFGLFMLWVFVLVLPYCRRRRRRRRRQQQQQQQRRRRGKRKRMTRRSLVWTVWSGKAFPYPLNNTNGNNGNDNNNNNNNNNNTPRTITTTTERAIQQLARLRTSGYFRVVVIAAAAIYVVATVLFVVEGLELIRMASQRINNHALVVNDLVQTLAMSIVDVSTVSTTATSTQNTLLLTLEQANNNNTGNTTTANVSSCFNSTEAVLETTLATLQFNQSYTVSNDDDILSYTNFIGPFLMMVATQSDNRLTLYQSIFLFGSYIVMTCVLVLGVLIAWFEAVQVGPYIEPVLNFFVVPVFMLQVFTAYTVGSILLVAATVNADFCSGGSPPSPDNTVLEVASLESDDNAFTNQVIDYYVGQCVAPYPFDSLLIHRSMVANNLRIVDSLLSASNNSTNSNSSANVTQECADVVRLVASLQTTLTGLLDSSRTAVDASNCRRISAFYVDATYFGGCNQAIRGLTWAFSTGIVAGVAGLIMITLRASWKADVDLYELYDDDDDDDLDDDGIDGNGNPSRQLDIYDEDDDDEFQTNTGSTIFHNPSPNQDDETGGYEGFQINVQKLQRPSPLYHEPILNESKESLDSEYQREQQQQQQEEEQQRRRRSLGRENLDSPLSEDSPPPRNRWVRTQSGRYASNRSIQSKKDDNRQDEAPVEEISGRSQQRRAFSWPYGPSRNVDEGDATEDHHQRRRPAERESDSSRFTRSFSWRLGSSNSLDDSSGGEEGDNGGYEDREYEVDYPIQQSPSVYPMRRSSYPLDQSPAR